MIFCTIMKYQNGFNCHLQINGVQFMLFPCTYSKPGHAMSVDLKRHKNKAYIVSQFHEYLLKEHRGDLLSLGCKAGGRSLVIHFSFLCEFNSIFSEILLAKPEETLALLNEGLRTALSETGAENSDKDKFTVHIRLTALPVVPEVHRVSVPWSMDVGKFIAFHGTVSRVGPVQVVESCRIYECSKCKHRFPVKAKFETSYSLHPPKWCPNRALSCKSLNLRPCVDGSFYAQNYQTIRIHEPYRCLSVGVMPRSISVCLEDDLLETVKPGDDVVVNGIVTRQWTMPKEGASCDVSLWIKANFIENLSELKFGSGSRHISHERAAEFEKFWSEYSNFTDALRGRNILVHSICPGVCGMYLIKLSIALLLAGSPQTPVSPLKENERPAGLQPSSRGCPHLLLIGDPGTAKSVLLRSATNLSNRAVLTTATGTTAAGLTATAIRDANGWTLDAGALVLADGGVCAIDEFTALQGTHRSAVHEAMEQQTISLAKAGLVTRLNCRCSVLAAANPPAGSDLYADEIGLPTPLLSRFDLIWRLVDPTDSSNWDHRMASFVLNLDKGCDDRMPEPWCADRLREYFSWVRQKFHPKLSKSAADLLQRYYIWRRQHLDHTGASSTPMLNGRTTLRLLESLVRLTKAHARLMARSEALLEDAVVVIALMDASLQSTVPGGSVSGIISSPCMSVPEAIVSTEVPLDAKSEFTEWATSVQQTLAHIQRVELVTSEAAKPNQCASSDDEIVPLDGSHIGGFSEPISQSDLPAALPLVTSTQLDRTASRIQKAKLPLADLGTIDSLSFIKDGLNLSNPSPSQPDSKQCLTLSDRICAKLRRFTPPHTDMNDLTAKPLTTHPVPFKSDLLSDVELTDEDFEIDLF